MMMATESQPQASPEAPPTILFLTVQRFCAERSLPKSTFYLHVRQGRIKLTKRGRTSLIKKAEADRYDNSLEDAA